MNERQHYLVRKLPTSLLTLCREIQHSITLRGISLNLVTPLEQRFEE